MYSCIYGKMYHTDIVLIQLASVGLAQAQPPQPHIIQICVHNICASNRHKTVHC